MFLKYLFSSNCSSCHESSLRALNEKTTDSFTVIRNAIDDDDNVGIHNDNYYVAVDDDDDQ